MNIEPGYYILLIIGILSFIIILSMIMDIPYSNTKDTEYIKYDDNDNHVILDDDYPIIYNDQNDTL